MIHFPLGGVYQGTGSAIARNDVTSVRPDDKGVSDMGQGPRNDTNTHLN